jgi:hypothetical protein
MSRNGIEPHAGTRRRADRTADRRLTRAGVVMPGKTKLARREQGMARGGGCC